MEYPLATGLGTTPIEIHQRRTAGTICQSCHLEVTGRPASFQLLYSKRAEDITSSYPG
ncbi:hypothetical protein J6590_027288 [Homalodisca vitripennis]|nr:hypothetical protein J6590_027288 [Homalodisca vitripennis]